MAVTTTTALSADFSYSSFYLAAISSSRVRKGLMELSQTSALIYHLLFSSLAGLLEARSCSVEWKL